ncbi:hypothetical protein E1B28_011928 [Marasmius oreades]|uniref:Methyltransferase n=1 Tax=Marasmius oreades TaxID=181124 RepID=A0A9P7RRC2_9AGAR|nr:uncharacterized protein E1B28_011928 [Marasmius oreades]KAG7087880.1 hypothetical protein E1B28_011928 [Marasmius oreades]
MSTADTSKIPITLSYFTLPKDGSKPRTYQYQPPAGVPQLNYETVPHPFEIENVRGKEHEFDLDNAGFLFARSPAKHQAFIDDEDIEREYYPESADLIKKLTGASKVVLFDHSKSLVRELQIKEAGAKNVTIYGLAIRRRREGESGTDPKKRIPVSRVHVDQTPKAAVNRVRRHIPPEEAEVLLKHRFQIINLWRPISHPALDWPLALCDFRSVDMKKDFVPVDLVYRDKVGETFGVQWNPKHEWKYLRGMTPEEVVLIKCYDSIDDGTVAALTPHTAFEDPTTPEGSPKRESIELRALVFYDD